MGLLNNYLNNKFS